MNKDRILLRISQVEQQLSNITEKLYHPDLTITEHRELSKKKNKLYKSKNKLRKRLSSLE